MKQAQLALIFVLLAALALVTGLWMRQSANVTSAQASFLVTVPAQASYWHNQKLG